MKVLLAIGRVYAVALSVNRDSPHPELLKAYKRVALKAHPDKGGTNEHFRALQTAKEKWDALRTTKAERPCGRRWENGGNATSLASAVGTGSSKTQFRVRGCSVLLTYQGFSDQAAWKDFLDFVRASLESWGVQHWCATLERSGTGKLHSHLVLQFRSAVDRSVRSFAFKGRLPNASVNDLLNEGVCRKKLQQSVDRSFFLRLGRQGRNGEKRQWPTLCGRGLPTSVDNCPLQVRGACEVVRQPLEATQVVTRALRSLPLLGQRGSAASKEKLRRGPRARTHTGRRRGTCQRNSSCQSSFRSF